MNGEQNEAINPIAKLAEFQQEQQLLSQANSTPMPGALRQAFSLTPDIQVGKYKVRPFVDRDMEYLQALDHPLHKHFNDKGGNLWDSMRGPAAWQICYLMTRPFKEIKTLIKEKGPQGLKDAAEEEFDEFQLLEIIELFKAIMRQVDIYWEPVIAFSSTEAEGSKKNLADGTGKPPTDSDTSLKNVA